MTLNEVNLSPYLLTHLYPESLVADNQSIAPPNTGKAEAVSKEWKSLGDNESKVLIAVQYEDVMHLPDEQLLFLTQLLKACQLGLNNVAIINLNNYSQVSYTTILEYYSATTILLFGFNPLHFGFPFDIPPYQVQTFSDYTIVHAPALQDLQNNKIEKGKLWSALKKIFNL